LSHFVEISIMDSGQGIPIELQHKLFQPFFTTKPQGKGTGLGLSIAARIIKAHQGVLSIDSQAAHTRFVISLPKTRTED
jgi:signal transduction histidine kinase